MLREDLSHIVTCAINCLISSGQLPEAARGPVDILDTKQPEHGDYACNFALAAAKNAGMNPRELAEKLLSMILEVDEAGVDDPTRAGRKMVSEGSPVNEDRRPALIHQIEIAGPGFLNLRLKPEAVAGYLTSVLENNGRVPQRLNAPTPQRVNVEFVSVNPNGPITVGSARGAAFGDTLCRVLEASGNQVNREYYINDGVNSEQMRLFSESVRHYYHDALGVESTFPEKGYRGDYVQEVALQLRATYGDGHDRELTDWFQARSQELMIERQRTDLHAFGVDFDTWFSEQSLHDSGEVERCVDEMIAKGAADEDPHRVVLKMARGGVIEEVKKEAQSETMESEELLEGEVTGTAGVSPAQSELGTSATLWLRSTKFGDDMDRVLRRRDGRLTYIASDVAYHKDKFNRPPNADKLITILGPDHHGYIHRLQAVLAALLETPSPATVGQAAELSQDSPRGVGEGAGGEGLDEVESAIYKSAAERDACKSALEEARRKLEVVIFQIVRFVKDGKPAPMRKRDGNIYELRDLISELGQAVAAKATKEEQQRIGVDVARFFYLMRSHDTHMDFDIDLATKQSDDNPVFYVQYAYARICSVLRKAGEARIGGLEDWGIGQPIPILQSFNPSILTHPREQSLIKKILDLPLEVQRITEDYGVHRLTTYAIELARTYHHFYDACRVIQTEEPELSKARLALCEAARLTLKATLDLLGVSAPERMEREEPTG